MFGWYRTEEYCINIVKIYEAPRLIIFPRNSDFRGSTSILYGRTLSEQLNFNLAQVNQGFSEHAYTLRGLHFQTSPHEQAKLVQVISGAIYNVAVDIRVGSPTFGVYCAETVKAEDHKAVYIPRGFAHGYLTLEDETLVQWCVDNDFCGDAAKCLRFDDKEIRSAGGEHGIPWPCESGKIIMSEKDRNGMSLLDIRNEKKRCLNKLVQ